MHRIHEPVPLFAKEIQRPVDGFMSRISTKQPFWRANWTVCGPCAVWLLFSHLCLQGTQCWLMDLHMAASGP